MDYANELKEFRSDLKYEKMMTRSEHASLHMRMRYAKQPSGEEDKHETD